MPDVISTVKLTESDSFPIAATTWGKGKGLLTSSGQNATLLISNSLSDVGNKPQARFNLGLEIGTQVQAYSSVLSLYAAGQSPTSFSLGLLHLGNKEQWQSTLGIDTALADLTAEDIPYNESKSVYQVLAELTYSAPTIPTFTATPNIIEYGATVSVVLNWTTTGNITTQFIDGNTVTLPATTFTYNNVTAAATYTYQISDNTGPNGIVNVSKSVSTSVRKRRYWGVSTNTTLTSSQIIALAGSELGVDKVKSFSADGGTSPGKYIYFAFPAEYGSVTNYKLFGFDETPVVTTVSVTTAVGATLNYTVLRSANPIIGTVNVEVS